MPPRKKPQCLLDLSLEAVGGMVAECAVRSSSHLDDGAVRQNVAAVRGHIFESLPPSLADPLASAILMELAKNSERRLDGQQDERYFSFVLVACHSTVSVLDFSNVTQILLPLVSVARMVNVLVRDLPVMASLETLDLGRCMTQLGQLNQRELFSKLKGLKNLTLDCSNCDIKALSKNCQELQKISLLSSPDAQKYFLNSLTSECRKLVEVDVRECDRIPTLGLINMLNNLANLRKLKHYWKTDQLNSLRSRAPPGHKFQLESLDLSMARGVQRDLLDNVMSLFPRLRLVIVGCSRGRQNESLPLAPLQRLQYLEQLQINKTSFTSNPELGDLLKSPVGSRLITLALLEVSDLDPVKSLILIGQHCARLKALLLKRCSFCPRHPGSEQPTAIGKIGTLEKLENLYCQGDNLAAAEFTRNCVLRLSGNVRHMVIAYMREDLVIDELLDSGALEKVESAIFESDRMSGNVAMRVSMAQRFVSNCPRLRALDVGLGLYGAFLESPEVVEFVKTARDQSWDLDLRPAKFMKNSLCQFYLSDF